jgi:toxin CptA
LLALGVLAALSLTASALPPAMARPAAALAMALAAWSAWREARRPARTLVWPAAGQPPTLDGQALREARLHWRGPLAFLRWRDAAGRRQHLAWWPDTLPPKARRELRLAAGHAAATPGRASMAG